MAKILGVREIVSYGRLPSFVERAQQVTLMGYGSYEQAHRVEHGGYDVMPLGQPKYPYDLGQPGAVAEIKHVLRELAKLGSDPLSSAPIVEDTWKFIDVSPDYIDSWDGPTADELLLAVSRHRAVLGPLAGAVYVSAAPVEYKGKLEIIGGPQPTVQGLELLAQAARKYLKDAVQLNNYLAWRGGDLDSWFSAPPDAVTIPAKRFGRPWDPRGWTFAWRDGPAAKSDPSLLGKLDLIEDSIKSSWDFAQHATTEQQRLARANILRDLRQQRHDVVMKLNVGAPPPECPEGLIWSGAAAQCVDRCPDPAMTWDAATGACVVSLPPVDITPYATYAECIDEHRKSGFSDEYSKTQCALEFPVRGSSAAAAVGVAAVAGLGILWWLSKRGRAPKTVGRAGDWTMEAPED